MRLRKRTCLSSYEEEGGVRFSFSGSEVLQWVSIIEGIAFRSTWEAVVPKTE